MCSPTITFALIATLAVWQNRGVYAFTTTPMTTIATTSRKDRSWPLQAVDPGSLVHTIQEITTVGELAVSGDAIAHTIRDVTAGGALAVSGDVIAQAITSKGSASEGDDPTTGLSFFPDNWDSVRTAALGIFGALYTGGAQHFIFAFLNSSFSDPIQRLLFAQFLCIPLLYYPTYLLLVPALRTLHLEDDIASEERERLQNQIIERLPATLLRNWTFWLPVQFVQFSFVAPDMHIMYCASFGVIWNAILSWSTMQEASPKIPDGIQPTNQAMSPSTRRENPRISVASEK